MFVRWDVQHKKCLLIWLCHQAVFLSVVQLAVVEAEGAVPRHPEVAVGVVVVEGAAVGEGVVGEVRNIIMVDGPLSVSVSGRGLCKSLSLAYFCHLTTIRDIVAV